MGGLKRPLSPVEAAETPAALAKDFIFLLKRMREIADSEVMIGEFVNLGIYENPNTGNLYIQD